MEKQHPTLEVLEREVLQRFGYFDHERSEGVLLRHGQTQNTFQVRRKFVRPIDRVGVLKNKDLRTQRVAEQLHG